MAAASVEFHTLESTVRGRHVYKTLWNPVVGHVLHIQSEDSNTYDRFAVATHLRASSFQSVASPEHLDSDIGFCCRSFSYRARINNRLYGNLRKMACLGYTHMYNNRQL